MNTPKLKTRIALLITTAVALSGCASLQPAKYSLATAAATANVTFTSNDEHLVGMTTYGEAQSCVGRQVIAPQGESPSSQTYKIEAGKPMALSFGTREGASGYGLSCHFTLKFTPQAHASYSVSTSIVDEKNICRVQIRNGSSAPAAGSVRVIDGILLGGFSEKSAFCEGKPGIVAAASGDLETSLHNYTLAQALMYDYTPFRLKRK